MGYLKQCRLVVFVCVRINCDTELQIDLAANMLNSFGNPVNFLKMEYDRNRKMIICWALWQT